MPVSTKTSTVAPAAKKECCGNGWEDRGQMSYEQKNEMKKDCCGHSCFGKKFIKTLVGILLVYAIVFMGTAIRNNGKKYFYIGKADKMERTIVVSGYGKVNGNNDIAVTTIGYSNTDKDVAKAQMDNKKVMDQIMSELKTFGVVEKDLQSNYTIFPDYNYTQQKGQELIGYKVTNQLSVKIRDLSKIPQILGLAGKYGATEVSGLSFTIDDPENLKMDARAKALGDAKSKAQYLSEKLGVRLGSVVSFNEYEGSNDVYQMKVMAFGTAEGGGGPESVASGSKDVVMNVSVTYEILP
ncbi:MAG: SIMPL domain-containing protein [Patescibacteria group bacterium]